MKKLIKFIATAAIVLSLLICCVYAAEIEDVIVKLQINNSVMKINGENSPIDPGRDTKPVIVNGRTLVPVRAIIEAFGGTVGWDEPTQTVILDMDDDVIRLTINSCVAYLNDDAHKLDVEPVVIDGRTMLPIRFVAEGFNLGVAWDEINQSVYIIRDTFTDEEYEFLMKNVPAYSGEPYAVVNGNIPYFNDFEIIPGSFEYYAELDELGRCDVCFSSIAVDIMPTQERESISSVTPTGWINAKYDVVDGGYLYNRCHLIGFQLTGENANERNLITGTRYLNVDGMLPFENDVARYIEQTGNRVVYRSTPVFSNNNLVADGVLLEAFSVEDNGEGISFCVYCYNVQPYITIDYGTGRSFSTAPLIDEEVYVEQDASNDGQTKTVYRTPAGKKYHLDMQCGGKNSHQVDLQNALDAGLEPCSRCVD